MTDFFTEYLANPVRSRIFFQVQSSPNITTKTLLEKLPDIAQPTLYRHIKAMLDGGVIKITGEKQIRGVVEKSYSIGIDFNKNIEKIITENDGTGYFHLFTQYLMGTMAEFRAYSESHNIDIVNDGSSFSTTSFYATPEELQEALAKIEDIVQDISQNEPTAGRALCNLCVISIPKKIKKNEPDQNLRQYIIDLSLNHC